MKKAIYAFITVAGLLASNSFAQDINITSGWQLLGATEDINVSNFDNTCVDYVWVYDTSGQMAIWKLYIADANSYYGSTDYDTVSIINKSQGYWLQGDSNCTISDTQSDSSSIADGGLTYKTITSPYTKRVWLDRNLGAQNACTSIFDEDCYGYYYQWGRASDGHQKITSKTTSTQATSTTNTGSDEFIISSSAYKHDWAYEADPDGAKRNAEWNPCPPGYGVPTIDELKAEIKEDENLTSDLPFDNFLNIPLCGFKDSSSGEKVFDKESGNLWANSIEDGEYYTWAMSVNKNAVSPSLVTRAGGLPIRCIKNK